MAEVHRADPGARRLALTIVGIGLAAGLLLLWGLETGSHAAARWLREDPAAMMARARLLLIGLAIVMGGPPIAAGVYLWRFGGRTVTAGRFPPPEARMVQDTLVLAGEPARSRGRLIRGAGAVLVLAGIGMLVLLLRLAAGLAAVGWS